jgi:hypothetical protein
MVMLLFVGVSPADELAVVRFKSAALGMVTSELTTIGPV